MKEITLENIKVGTVIVTCGKLAIVERVMPNRPKNSIQYKNNTEHRGYICGINDVQAILGDVDIAEWQGALTPKAPIIRAERNDSWAMPEELRAMGLTVGDTILVKHGHSTRKATFKGYNANRPKYPVSYEINGKSWKGTKGIVVGKA